MICERIQNQNKTNDEEDVVESKYSNEANKLLSDLSNSMMVGKNGNESNQEGKVLMKGFLISLELPLNIIYFDQCFSGLDPG